MGSGSDRRGIPAGSRCCAVIVLALVAMGVFARTSIARQRSIVASLMRGHPYRHGVVPVRGPRPASAPPPNGAAAGNLVYKGGLGGVGVVTGAPRVYLVFWGAQWGFQATNGQGDVTLSGDLFGMAPRLQEFMKGLGTDGETWSGVMTQYCQGVSLDAQTCPLGAAHVAYPSGGVLAGVWADESTFAPFQATGHQIGVEALSAAAHFANPVQNPNDQYVIVSPPGTHPDGFNTGNSHFCAWHDSTGDSTLSGGAATAADSQLAFTNLPYLTDAGTRCGTSFVNPGPAGALDGVTIIEGHEYAETLTDPYPPDGWVDTSGNETGDKCAWIAHGPGASQDIQLSTGSFAVQSTWANDIGGGSGGCETTHPLIGN